MTPLYTYDHYSSQDHENVTEFLKNWCNRAWDREHEPEYHGCPWDDANIPVQLWVSYENGEPMYPKSARVLVLLPRKSHVKWVKMRIDSEIEEEWFRASLAQVPQYYRGAAAALEDYATNGMDSEDGADDHYNGNVWFLYYWGNDE